MNSLKPKIGNYLYCHSNGYMEEEDCHEGEVFCKKGKYYEIIRVISDGDESYDVYIKSELFGLHQFVLHPSVYMESDLSKWFRVVGDKFLILEICYYFVKKENITKLLVFLKVIALC
jgi:hypothetical protein